MRAVAIFFFALSLLLMVVPTHALAKPFDASGTDWEGLGDFVQLARDDLGANRVVVASTLDMRELKREDAIVVVHPERALDADQLSSFMRHGGRVVLLDDYGTGDGLLRHFGIARVPMPSRPAETLRGNPSLAIAEPASNHPAVQGVGKVVTNHATGVRHPDLSPVLKVRALGEPDVLLAEAGAVGQGRFLAVGDASVVINAMMRYPGNKALARGLLHYATDDDTWGKRGGRVFFVIGDFEQTGVFGSTGSAFWDRVNEYKRAIDDAIEQVRRDGMPPAAAYVLAVVMGLAIVMWIGSRAGKTHRATPPRFVRGIPLVVQGGVAGHAAVIGAPSTSRVLAMLELKSAIEEDLCGLLGLEGSPGVEALVAKVGAAGLLDANELSSLKRILARLTRVETGALAARGPMAGMDRIRDREVLEMAGMMRKLLVIAHERNEHENAPRSTT